LIKVFNLIFVNILWGFAPPLYFIINFIMVVGWWCDAGVTRKREDPHNHLGGWWGQPANRTKQA
jgi:hypothetical protein